MNTSPDRRGKPGFVSYVLVLSTGLILTVLMVFAYRRSLATQTLQAKVQLRTDYGEKEDAILRSIVAIAPNRAIRAMKGGSDANSTTRNPLRWKNIFTESLVLANARTSISTTMLDSMGLSGVTKGNSGDSALASPNRVFSKIGGANDDSDTSYASGGINRSLGTGFPPPLTTANATTIARDPAYPIISRDKVYGSLAQSYLNTPTLNGDGLVGYGLPVGNYPGFNRLRYPNINFGYARPGDPFVAKRNWWAFSLDVAAHDDALTKLARPSRDFVLSIYEIPSQLAISASSFMSLGQFASGEAWQNVTIDGGVFAGKVAVEGATTFSALAARRGMTLSGDSTIGGQSFVNNPFTPGVREAYQLTQGEFFPVSLASESGRVAFVAINRGEQFFDRFDRTTGALLGTEASVLSPTAWDNYSIGALQCAMRLDITKVVSSTDKRPAELRFDYLRSDGSRRVDTWPLINKAVQKSLPSGYTYVGPETSSSTAQSYTYTEPTDLAYGYPGVGYSFILGFTGTIRFDNATFGDPAYTKFKSGYARPASPFRPKDLPNGKYCIKVLPERIAGFLASIGAANTSINNSLVVNVDYSNLGPTYPVKPSIPCTDLDYGVILQECGDLTSFTKGFSLVTNLRTYIGDDFNNVEVPKPWPTGYAPAVTAANPDGKFYPPCSLFTPEKRYGVEVDPFIVNVGGQVGSLASETDTSPVRPLDSKTMSGTSLGADRITVNLRPITHPAELPPITMMNWLVVLEERRKEFVGN